MTPTLELSTAKDYDDFIRRALRAPIRVMLERTPRTREQERVDAYDDETERLRAVVNTNNEQKRDI